MKNGILINTEHGKLIPEIRSQTPFGVCFGLAWHAFESRAFDQINDILYFLFPMVSVVKKSFHFSFFTMYYALFYDMIVRLRL